MSCIQDCPIRLIGQDTALSRRQYRFESGMGHQHLLAHSLKVSFASQSEMRGVSFVDALYSSMFADVVYLI